MDKWDKKSKLLSTGKDVTKMGETQYWDEFAKHNSTNDILSKSGSKGNFADPDAHINFGVSKDSYVAGLSGQYRDIAKDNISVKAKSILASESANGGDYDIKVKLGPNEGYLYNGKYTSGESLGNQLFGINVSSLYDNNSITLKVMYNKEGFFKDVMKAAGAYHNKQNKVNNEAVAPYFGEINYTGRNVVHGYFKKESNGYLNQYKNSSYTGPIYGNIKFF